MVPLPVTERLPFLSGVYFVTMLMGWEWDLNQNFIGQNIVDVLGVSSPAENTAIEGIL